jgi:hypothetical protein
MNKRKLTGILNNRLYQFMFIFSLLVIGANTILYFNIIRPALERQEKNVNTIQQSEANKTQAQPIAPATPTPSPSTNQSNSTTTQPKTNYQASPPPASSSSSSANSEKDKICSSLKSGYIGNMNNPRPDSTKILRAIGTPDYDSVVATYNTQAKLYNDTQEGIYQRYISSANSSGCTNLWPRVYTPLSMY